MGKNKTNQLQLKGIGIILFALFVCVCLLNTVNSTDNSYVSNIKTPVPTLTQKPFFTPTISLKATKTQITLLNACVRSNTIRIRENPGTEFNVIGGLASGTCFKIISRNSDSSWAYIVTSENVNGWVASWLITVQGNLSSLPVTSSIISYTPTPNLLLNQSLSENTNNNGNNNRCHPAYPSVCIPVGRDLDCKDIPYRNFAVPGGDPYNFDGDNDGVGCET